MTTLAGNLATEPAPPPPLPPSAPTRWSRWSDRLNPILVREVQQAMKGRVFTLTVWLTLIVIVMIAVATVNHYEPRGSAGRMAFDAGFATLMPLMVFVVPMQAYQSMRLELRSGIVEQLLLSRLTPMRILFGKLQAAMVQFALYVAVLSPLLATSYLLRGVDLPTIVASLGFALLVCVAATAVAVSSAAQAVLPAMQPIAQIGTAFGLGMASFGLVGWAASGFWNRGLSGLLRSPELGMAASAFVLTTLAATALSLLAARSFLVHTFENKATGFRVYLFVVLAVALGWVAVFVDPIHRDEVLPMLLFVALVVGIVFGLFMVTEQAALSPRLAAHVPTGSVTGILVAPFLPGRDRGIACFVIYAAVLVGIAWWVWPNAGATRPFAFTDEIARMGLLTLAYALVYLGLGRWLRARLPANQTGNYIGRFLLPGVLFLFMLVPALIDLFTRGEVDAWHVGHVMNPVWAMEQFAWDRENWPAAEQPAKWAVVAGLALQLPTILRGVREVLAAGRARKARLAGAA